MQTKVRLVVGDAFHSFAANAGVIRVSQLQQWLDSGQSTLTREMRFVFGQGLCESELEHIRVRALQRGLPWLAAAATGAPTTHTAHKSDAENVLLADPQRIGPRQYQSQLRLEAGFSGLMDHVTGQHIGGIVAVEAARQATIVAVELEYSSAWEEQHQFVMRDLVASFSGYLFPAPCSVRTRIEELEGTPARGLSLTVTSELYQAGALVCTVNIGTHVRRAAAIGKLEARQARAVVEACLADNEAATAEATANVG